jgi:hypothetical protein
MLYLFFSPPDDTSHPYYSPQPPPHASLSIQLSTYHSKLLYPPTPHILPRSLDIQKIKSALEILKNSCISCWLLQSQPLNDHQLQGCTYHPNMYTQPDQYFQWKRLLKFAERTCFGCGCPQTVMSYIHVHHHVSHPLQLHFTGPSGIQERLHEFHDGRPEDCIYKDTLLQMAWLIPLYPTLSEPLVASPIRQNQRLDFEPCPFHMWITLSPLDDVLANILTVFLFYLNLLGPPSLPLQSI